VELQGRQGELRNIGLEVAAITYDSPSAIKAFAAERAIQFPLLSDEDHSIVERYGILNREFEPGHRNYGIPHPGTFILDRDGRVLARYFEEEYQYRNTAASLALKIGQPLAGLGAPVRQTTPHVEIATFVTDQSVAPGQRFSIVLDVTPGPGMHVVAPGQHSYRVVALELTPDDNVRTYEVAYPPSTAAVAAAGSGRVPAYTEPFRLIQDVAIVVNGETRQRAQQPGAVMTVRGTLEYQACTADACSPPERVPFSWTVGLRPLG
jgi:hypothetical protein